MVRLLKALVGLFVSLIGGLLSLGLACYFLYTGGRGVWTAFRNPQPLELECKELAQRPPQRTWLRISGCAAPLAEAVLLFENDESDSEKATSELYIPLVPVTEYQTFLEQEEAQMDDEQLAEPVVPVTSLVLSTQRSDLTQIWNEMDRLSRLEDNPARNQEWESFSAKHASQLLGKDVVEGLVRTGWDRNEVDEARVRTGHDMLRDDFLVLDSDARPSWAIGLSFLGIGVLCLLFAMFRLLRAILSRG